MKERPWPFSRGQPVRWHLPLHASLSIVQKEENGPAGCSELQCLELSGVDSMDRAERRLIPWLAKGRRDYSHRPQKIATN